MDRTIDSNKDFMNFPEFYVFFVLKNFPIALKKLPISIENSPRQNYGKSRSV